METSKNEKLARTIAESLERDSPVGFEAERQAILAVLERESMQENTTPESTPDRTLFDANGYADAAREEGFEPDEIEGFEQTARRAHALGIMPADVAEAIGAGRIVYDFDTERVRIDGQ